MHMLMHCRAKDKHLHAFLRHHLKECCPLQQEDLKPWTHLPRLLLTPNPRQFMNSAKYTNLWADSHLLPDSGSAGLYTSHSGYCSARPWLVLLPLLDSSSPILLHVSVYPLKRKRSASPLFQPFVHLWLPTPSPSLTS